MKRYIHASKDVDISPYLDKGFDNDQIEQIRQGLESGVDVSIYANPEFDWSQMGAIRAGLKSGVDVSIYADPKFEGNQMRQIKYGLEEGVDVGVYADPEFDQKQMGAIREGLEQGLDVSIYADPKFNDRQMDEIRWGLEDGLDVSIYADPKFSVKQMREIRQGFDSQGLDSQNTERLWPAASYLENIETDEEFEDFWSSYLGNPEDEVNSELELFLEPSVQGGMGDMVIMDESDNDNEPIYIDFQDWCDKELDMAIDSGNADQYKEKYKAYLLRLIEDAGWER